MCFAAFVPEESVMTSFRTSFRSVVVFLGGLVSLQAVLAAQVSGTVTRPDGKPAGDVRVILVETGRSTFTDEAGAFAFEDVPAGSYHLQAVSRGLGTVVAEFDVDADDAARAVVVPMRLSISPHKETIVVTATRSGAGSDEIVQPANVLDTLAITEKMQPTLGEMLGNEPGVSQSFFAPGASRPIIRGQDGGRVRMLEHGIGTGDASAASADHAVAIDPALAEQIEVIRGAATLLYGSAAVGGVVNVIDRRIPDRLPSMPVTGGINARLGSAADERALTADMNGRFGSLAWHLDGAVRETDDYEIPGHAEVEEPGEMHDPDEPVGFVPNSAMESEKFTGGLSWVFDESGFAGASYTRFQTRYGIPGGHGHEEEDPMMPMPPDEPPVSIDLKQERIDLRGGFNVGLGPFERIDASLATVDYTHTEFEGSEPGTVFENDTLESRVELHNGAGARLRGTIGLQYLDQETDAIGDEAFVPSNTTESIALFGLQRLDAGSMHWEAGLRYETQDNRTIDPLLDRDFDGVSGNVGLLHRFADERWAIGGSLTSTERLPSGEELYADGPHAATLSYEIGDPDLSVETARGAELTVRKESGKLSGSLNLFHNRFDDYIFLEQQFDTMGNPILIDDLPVFQQVQRDAEFEGYELELTVGLHHDDHHDFDLILRSDQTMAELRDTGEALPRIPAQRYSAALDFRSALWGGMIELAYNDDVTGADVALTATPTESSAVLNASVTRRFIGDGVVHTLILRGTNLTDEDIRLNTSRVKDSVPLPGVDVSLIYRLQF